MMKTAFVFPGQGSQAVGMLGDFAQNEPLIGKTFAEASEALGYDLWQVVQSGPEEKLASTEVTQPALLTAGVALYRLWLSKGKPAPDLMAGHSLGEYTALCCAGSFSLGDAVRLVETRGRLMQAAVPAGSGKMAAILGLDDEVIREICACLASKGVVEPVNFNSPGQVVIAGEAGLVDEACVLMKEKGAKRALPLAVSVPSHCALMRPAADQLVGLLSQISVMAPVVPVINNVDVKVEASSEAIRSALVRQLYSPVRWTETGFALAEAGVGRLFECGPGKVLTGLMKRIDERLECMPLGKESDFAKALEV